MSRNPRAEPRALVLFVLAAGTLLAAPALAGSSTPPAPAPRADDRPDPVCASYGKGFVRLEGTSTCVKITGNVQADGYQQSLPTGDPLAPALRSR